jgi:hypothetical protein
LEAPMSDEQAKRIIVTVDDHHLPEIQTVAIALQAEGMRVDQLLPGIGIITGEVSQSKIPDLKRVTGVVDVEVDQEMQAI